MVKKPFFLLYFNKVVSLLVCLSPALIEQRYNINLEWQVDFFTAQSLLNKATHGGHQKIEKGIKKRKREDN